jgi:redox-regulated HSP33 family molecular chaperone
MTMFQANLKLLAAAEAHEAAAEAHRMAARLLAAGNLMAAVEQTYAADRSAAKASEASAMAVFCLTSDASGNVRNYPPLDAMLIAEGSPV